METSPSPFRAISDPTRRSILDALREEGPLRAGDLAQRFATISRPAVSKHVRVLRGAGLVVQSQNGRERWYSLNPTPLQQVQAWVDNYETYWREKLDELKEMVEGEE
jgi:DNA-binding transcriptional ArsR family regulator